MNHFACWSCVSPSARQRWWAELHNKGQDQGLRARPCFRGWQYVSAKLIVREIRPDQTIFSPINRAKLQRPQSINFDPCSSPRGANVHLIRPRGKNGGFLFHRLQRYAQAACETFNTLCVYERIIIGFVKYRGNKAK